MQGKNKAGLFKFGQVFGTKETAENIQEEDIITNLSFDPTGTYLSLGDNAGRVILFKLPNDTKDSEPIYDYYSEFQSHNNQFDFLKNMQVPQKIVKVCWLRHQGKYLKLLTTNSQSIKLWKAFQKSQKKLLKSANKDLSMPKFESSESSFYTSQQKIFPKIHNSPINSISQSNNEQYLLTSDSDKNYFWSLENPKKPFIVSQISSRNNNISDETKLKITCSKMHPISDSLFLFGLNRNGVGVCDLRISSGNRNVVDFGVQAKSTRNFFTEMISCISSADFLPNSRYVIAREYLNIKIWDMANTRKPLLNVCVNDSIKSQLCQLFEQEKIEDKFNIALSPDSSSVLTGSYNNCFNMIDTKSGQNFQYELSFRNKTICNPIIPKKVIQPKKVDTDCKTSVLAYHPSQQIVAVASMNCFFLYNMKQTENC